MGSGIIRGYAVYVVEVNELDNPIMAENEEETLDGNTHELAIFGLTPSARYRLQVAGYTRRGGGIRSSPAYVTVEGGGMCTYKLPSTKNFFHPNNRLELQRDKTNQMSCAPSKDSDQPGHPPSLIIVFAVRSMCS